MSRSLIACFWLLACPAVLMAQTRVEIDRQADFYNYKTFTVEVAPPVLADGVKDVDNTIAENNFRDAVTRELLARGLEPATTGADLVVKVSSRQSERTEIVSSGWGAYPWGWNGYWGSSYAAWSPYGGNVWTYNYLEGTVTIDVMDHDAKQLVYRGKVSRELGKHADKDINKAVHKAFKKFPIPSLDFDD